MEKADKVKDALTEEQLKIIEYMNQLTPGTEQYDKAMAALKALEMIKKPKKGFFAWTNKISPEVWVAIIGVFGQLSSILLVMNYEQLHILTSKAWTLATRRGR